MDPDDNTPNGWHEGVPETVRSDPAWDRFKDASSLADFATRAFSSYTNAERKLGQKGIPVPAENASPQQVREFFGRLGCPDSPDKYSRVNDGLPENTEVDPEFENFMAEACWGIGLADPQWSRIRQKLIEYGHSQDQKLLGEYNNAMEEAAKQLRTEWGAAYDKKTELAEQAMDLMFGDEKEIVRQVQIDGKPIGSHPMFLRAFGTLGAMLDEADILKGQAPRSAATLSPAEAKAEWARLQADPAFTEALMDKSNAGHRAAVERKTLLYRQMHPSGSDGKGAMATGKTGGSQ